MDDDLARICQGRGRGPLQIPGTALHGSDLVFSYLNEQND
jgi:hypothetical protein